MSENFLRLQFPSLGILLSKVQFTVQLILFTEVAVSEVDFTLPYFLISSLLQFDLVFEPPCFPNRMKISNSVTVRDALVLFHDYCLDL